DHAERTRQQHSSKRAVYQAERAREQHRQEQAKVGFELPAVWKPVGLEMDGQQPRKARVAREEKRRAPRDNREDRHDRGARDGRWTNEPLTPRITDHANTS